MKMPPNIRFFPQIDFLNQRNHVYKPVTSNTLPANGVFLKTCSSIADIFTGALIKNQARRINVHSIKGQYGVSNIQPDIGNKLMVFKLVWQREQFKFWGNVLSHSILKSSHVATKLAAYRVIVETKLAAYRVIEETKLAAYRVIEETKLAANRVIVETKLAALYIES